MRYLSLIWFVLFTQIEAARRQLFASSLSPCMPNSQLSATTFDVNFDPDTRALTYNLNLNSEINDYVIAKIQVYAYGFTVIEKTIDLCSMSFKQFCPLFSGQVIVDSTEYLNHEYADMIPGIAYTVPDIDGYVKVMVENTNGTNLACMAAYFSNGKTVSHTGAKWATAVVAGLGLFVSAFLSVFGNSNAASHISANASSLFVYFQSVVLISMLHVQLVPPIASAWAENLAWSMGLIRTEFMQKIFRWYIQATGGTPSLVFKDKSKLILVQRGLAHMQKRVVEYMQKRAAPLVVNTSDTLTVLRGIKRVGYKAHIEITSIVITGFTFFIFCGYFLATFLILTKLILDGLIKFKIIKNENTAGYFRSNFRLVLKGALLKYMSIGFVQLTVFSLWEFTENDSGALMVLAVLFLISAVGISGWAAYRTYYFGTSSIANYKNPAAILYGNQKVLGKYGFSYTMYHADKFWWGGGFLIFNLVKAIFVALCQGSGKTQALVIFILDLGYLVAVARYKPFLDKSTNILNIIICTVVMLNSFFFLFFSNLFHQPAAVASIMGWVFFILNAAFSLILLIIVIIYIFTAIFSKVPDARFRRAGDDRTSFQRNSAMFIDEKSINSGPDNFKMPNTPNPGAEELLDLGITAKQHTSNWEDEIYKLKDMVNSRGDLVNDHQTRSKENISRLRNVNSQVEPGAEEPVAHNVTPSASESFGSKVARSLSWRKKNQGQNGAVTSLGRKLSAIKLSRNNSLAKKSNAPMGSGQGVSVNPTQAIHQRQTSATPINSPGEDFNFIPKDRVTSQSKLLDGDYSHFNSPLETADIIGGDNSKLHEYPENSPYRQPYDSEEESQHYSYGKKF